MRPQLTERLQNAGSERKLFGRIHTNSCKRILKKSAQRLAVGI